MSKTVKCPTCGKKVKWDASSPWRPFCSDRCRLIDLGEWADESHCIPGEDTFPEEFIDMEEKKRHFLLKECNKLEISLLELFKYILPRQKR